MSAEIHDGLVCDSCHRQVTAVGLAVDDLRVTVGWVREPDGRDICPVCATSEERRETFVKRLEDVA